MNQLLGVFTLFAYVMVVFFGFPLAAVFILNLALGRGNFRKEFEEPVVIEQPLSLQSDYPIPISYKMTVESNLITTDAIPKD